MLLLHTQTNDHHAINSIRADSLRGFNLCRSPGGIVLEPGELTLAGIKRRFELTALTADIANHRLELQLQIITDNDTKSTSFTVGFYDFPMIDNTRLSADQRCAVVLNNFCEDESCAADVTLIFFPGSRASLQERAFPEDVIRQLQTPLESGPVK
jgi:hypothetical protein